MLYGVDVHDGYQAGLSFPTLAAQGYTFAAVKFTQGTTYVREQADEWVQAARAAGLIPGAYHWLNAADGAAQARWFYKNLAKVGGPEGLLIQCDNEDNATWQVTKDWAAEWEQLSGGHPFLMYTGAWWWGASGRRWEGVSLTPYLWHSRYLSADADSVPDDPAAFAARIPADWWTPGYGGWTAATFLQFTSRGDAGGLANNVDLNVTKLTREQLLALTTAAGADMSYDTADRARDIATTNRALAALTGTDAKYRIPGESTDRVETNDVRSRLTRVEAVLGALSAAVLGDLPTRLAAILDAALDDGDTTVVLSPEALAELTAIKATLAALPADTAEAVADEAAARLTE